MFFMLHEKYEELYNEAAEVIDEIAERVLMLGGPPLHTYEEYLRESDIKAVYNVTNGREGVEIVLANTRFLDESFKEIFEIASGNSDEGTVAMMSYWIGASEKRIWMLESYFRSTIS